MATGVGRVDDEAVGDDEGVGDVDPVGVREGVAVWDAEGLADGGRVGVTAAEPEVVELREAAGLRDPVAEAGGVRDPVGDEDGGGLRDAVVLEDDEAL